MFWKKKEKSLLNEINSVLGKDFAEERSRQKRTPRDFQMVQPSQPESFFEEDSYEDELRVDPEIHPENEPGPETQPASTRGGVWDPDPVSVSQRDQGPGPEPELPRAPISPETSAPQHQGSSPAPPDRSDEYLDRLGRIAGALDGLEGQLGRMNLVLECLDSIDSRLKKLEGLGDIEGRLEGLERIAGVLEAINQKIPEDFDSISLKSGKKSKDRKSKEESPQIDMFSVADGESREEEDPDPEEDEKA